MKLKRNLGVWLSHCGIIFEFLRKINLAIFQWDKRQQDKNFGSLNSSLKFYVVRSEGTREGLFGLYLPSLKLIYQSLQDGFIPVVDFKNYKTQYNLDSPVNGTYNAWEYYFEQPCSYSLEEVYKSKNVRLSGWKMFAPPPI